MFQDTRPAALGPDGGPDAWADFRVADSAERLRLLKQLARRQRAGDAERAAGRGRQLPAVVDRPGAAADQLQRRRRQRAHAAAGALRRGGGRGLPGQRQAAVRPERPGAGARRQQLCAARRAAGRALPLPAPRQLSRAHLRAPCAAGHAAPPVDARHADEPAHRRRQRRRLRAGAARRRARAAARQPPGRACASSSTATPASTPRCGCSMSARCTAAASGVRLGCEFVELDGQAQRALQRYIDHTQQRRRLLSLR